MFDEKLSNDLVRGNHRGRVAVGYTPKRKILLDNHREFSDWGSGHGRGPREKRKDSQQLRCERGE